MTSSQFFLSFFGFFAFLLIFAPSEERVSSCGRMGASPSRKVGEHYTFYIGECSYIGKRKYNEDHVIVKVDLPPKGKKKFEENPSLFAVCDGHSGARCSEYLRTSLPDIIRSHSKYGEKDAWEEVLVDSFQECDQKFLKNAKKKVFLSSSPLHSFFFFFSFFFLKPFLAWVFSLTNRK